MIKSNSKRKKKLFFLERELITTKVVNKNSKYYLNAYLGDKLLIDVKRPLHSYNEAVLLGEKVKDIIVNAVNKELNKFSKTRKNPSIADQDAASFAAAIRTSIGMPMAPEDAYELGRFVGMRDTLKNYCGVLKIFERRKVENEIRERIEAAYADLHKQIAGHRAGIMGAIIPRTILGKPPKTP